MENSIHYHYGDDIHPRLDEGGRTMFAYWESLRQDRAYPRKSEFDPMQVPKALPGVQIVEIVEKPIEFKYRLVGTREVEARGWVPTGRPVADGFIGPNVDVVLKHYRTTIETEAPLGVTGIYRLFNGLWVEDISLFLPMADEKGDLKFVFVYSYQKSPPKEGLYRP